MSFTPIDRGTYEPQLQRQIFTRDFAQGTSYAEEWAGLSPSRMVDRWNSTGYTAKSGTLTIDKGMAEMRLVWAGDGTSAGNSLEVTIDRWEIPEPVESKDLFQHPAFLLDLFTCGGTSGGSYVMTDGQASDIISIMRSGAEKARGLNAGSYASNRVTTETNVNKYWGITCGKGVYLNPTDRMMRFYDLYANNQTHYRAATYACRHTTSAPAYWSRNVADVNVNRVLTQAQFLSETTNAALWLFPLPGRLQYKLAAAFAAFTTVHWSRPNYLNGWLKSPSAESSVGRGRIEIQSHYLLDQWSTDLYPLAT